MKLIQLHGLMSPPDARSHDKKYLRTLTPDISVHKTKAFPLSYQSQRYAAGGMVYVPNSEHLMPAKMT